MYLLQRLSENVANVYKKISYQNKFKQNVKLFRDNLSGCVFVHESTKICTQKKPIYFHNH